MHICIFLGDRRLSRERGSRVGVGLVARTVSQNFDTIESVCVCVIALTALTTLRNTTEQSETQ